MGLGSDVEVGYIGGVVIEKNQEGVSFQDIPEGRFKWGWVLM